MSGLERSSTAAQQVKSARRAWSRWRRRREIIDFLGGCCAHCGWTGHIGAYHVHHTDPSKKVFARTRGATRFGAAYSTTPLTDDEREELATCQLLCANCHALESVGSRNPYINIVNAHTATVASWDDVWDSTVARGKDTLRTPITET